MYELIKSSEYAAVQCPFVSLGLPTTRVMLSVSPENLEPLLGFERTVRAVAETRLVDDRPDCHVKHLNGLRNLAHGRPSKLLQDAAFSVVRQVAFAVLSHPSGTSVVRVGLQVAKVMERLWCVAEGDAGRKIYCCCFASGRQRWRAGSGTHLLSYHLMHAHRRLLFVRVATTCTRWLSDLQENALLEGTSLILLEAANVLLGGPQRPPEDESDAALRSLLATDMKGSTVRVGEWVLCVHPCDAVVHPASKQCFHLFGLVYLIVVAWSPAVASALGSVLMQCILRRSQGAVSALCGLLPVAWEPRHDQRDVCSAFLQSCLACLSKALRCTVCPCERVSTAEVRL